MNYAALQTEILTGPRAAECAGKSDGEIADILNAPTLTKRAMVPIADLQSYIYTNGTVWWDIQSAAANTAHPGYMVARATMDLMGARFNNLDFLLPRVQEVLDGLVLSGLITATHRADLEAMSHVPASRAEIAGLGMVTHQDVAKALRG